MDKIIELDTERVIYTDLYTPTIKRDREVKIFPDEIVIVLDVWSN